MLAPWPYTSGDPVALAKALSSWVKDNAEFTFKLGIVDGKVINVDEIGDLAKLPGKEELFSKLLFLIQSPAQRLATVINATGRDLAVVLNQGVEKEKFVAGSTPATATAEPAAPEGTAAGEIATGHVAEAHAEETPTPTEEIAQHPASEADPVAEQPSGAAQPENGTASQAGEAAATDPVERLDFYNFAVSARGGAVWAQRKPEGWCGNLRCRSASGQADSSNDIPQYI